MLQIEYDVVNNKIMLPMLPYPMYPDRWRNNCVDSIASGLCVYLTTCGLNIVVPPLYSTVTDEWQYAYTARRRYPECDVFDINFVTQEDLFYLVMRFGVDALHLYRSFFEYEEAEIARKERLTK